MDGLLSQSGRSWVEIDGHSTKSGRSLEIILSIEVDGPKVSNWTVQKCQTGRSKSIKLDGPKGSNWTVPKCQTGRSESLKLDGSNVLKWTVQKKYYWRFKKIEP